MKTILITLVFLMSACGKVSNTSSQAKNLNMLTISCAQDSCVASYWINAQEQCVGLAEETMDGWQFSGFKLPCPRLNQSYTKSNSVAPTFVPESGPVTTILAHDGQEYFTLTEVGNWD